MTRLTAISLYTGAGGLDYGFEAAGIETTITVEMDKDCCATLRASRRWNIIEDRIERVATSTLLKQSGLRPGEVGLVIGGPPCQPFSKSGYWASGDTKRLADPRADTLGAFLRVVQEAQPWALLLENVEGIKYKDKSDGLDFVRDRLREINATCGTAYTPFEACLNAADYGVPQLRRRVFVVAARDGRDFRFPEPTHSENGAGGECHRTAWDAIGDLPAEPNEDLAIRGKWADLLPSIPEGWNYLWHTERGGGEPLFGWRTRYWSFLLKLAKSRPAWTVQAQPGPATGPFHWRNRMLSVREMCRLQTFPETVTIAGDHASARRQLGNAVASLVAEVLARAIRKQLLDAPHEGGPLQLLPRRASFCPPPEPLKPVPLSYMYLRGKHHPHPGTGLGPAALARNGLKPSL
jgi:DNA (cytosine-5)-methyltransferase 1